MMHKRRFFFLLAVLGMSIVLGGCQIFGGAKNQSANTTALAISLDQIIGFWESQAQSVGKTGYFYRFNQDGTLSLYEETPDNLVLNGTFTIEEGTNLNLQLTNPRDGAVILGMTWQLVNVEANELVFRIMPDDGVIWLRRVN